MVAFEAYHLGAKTFEIYQRLGNIDETLQESEDQISELQTPVARFESSIIDLNEELEHLQPQKIKSFFKLTIFKIWFTRIGC